MDFRIFSHGGVGSKQVVKWLYPDAPANWAGAHRHDPLPPRQAPDRSRMIYVFGDPRNAAISMFQRRDGRHERHGFRPRTPAELDEPQPGFMMRHAANIGADPGTMDTSWSLAQFVEAGRDLFGFEHHVDNWLSSDTDYPVVFLRYETFWEHMPAILERLGMRRPAVPFLPRRADWRAQPTEIQRGLDHIYGRLCGRLADLPDVFVLRSGQTV